MISATWRLHRDGKLARREVARAERRIELLAERWTEIDALVPVREQAQRLLRLHTLTAADALQLAAALVAVDHRPRHRAFVSFDEALLEAAEVEGFDVVRPASR
jgi:predicted nucleic acid-binding protein